MENLRYEEFCPAPAVPDGSDQAKSIDFEQAAQCDAGMQISHSAGWFVARYVRPEEALGSPIKAYSVGVLPRWLLDPAWQQRVIP